MKLEQEINKRRTFAIISHPDAGKTTLTEKLLLFGGAIHVAGAVKSNKIKKTATSDFMEIEKQRGISVATSVMGFNYRDKKINILDTPGHKDFAEDTYRTLTAVDSVIIVIDVAKGVETQTEKLAEVCRMRNTPVMVFVNKLDRDGKDAFDLLDEIEQKLKIKVRPLSWPIGMGYNLKGVYNMYHKTLNLFQADVQQVKPVMNFDSLDNKEIDEYIGDEAAGTLREEVELVDGVYPEFSLDDYLSAKVAPVFFGSPLHVCRRCLFPECCLEFAHMRSEYGVLVDERKGQHTERSGINHAAFLGAQHPFCLAARFPANIHPVPDQYAAGMGKCLFCSIPGGTDNVWGRPFHFFHERIIFARGGEIHQIAEPHCCKRCQHGRAVVGFASADYEQHSVLPLVGAFLRIWKVKHGACHAKVIQNYFQKLFHPITYMGTVEAHTPST